MAEILRLCGLGKCGKTQKTETLYMKNSFFGLLLVGVALVLGVGCSSPSQMDIETKSVSVRTVGTNEVEKTTFFHRDKSKIRGKVSIGKPQPRLGGPVPVSQYGYGAGSYGYHVGGTYVQGLAGPQPITGWPVETRPSWMQGADWHRTQEMYRGSRIQSGGGFHY